MLEVDVAANAKLLPGVLPSAGHGQWCNGTGMPEVTIPGGWMLFSSVTLQFMLVYELSVPDRAAGLAGLQSMMKHETLRHAVGLTLPLTEIAAGHEAVEGRDRSWVTWCWRSADGVSRASVLYRGDGPWLARFAEQGSRIGRADVGG